MPTVDHSTLTGADLHDPKPLEYAQVYTLESDAQSVGSIGTTGLTFPFVNNGENNTAVADASNNRITCTTAGVYSFNFTVAFATAAAGDAGIYEFKLYDDGAATGFATAANLSGSSDNTSLTLTAVLSVGAGSQMTINIESDEAGDTDDINIYTSSFTAFRIGD